MRNAITTSCVGIPLVPGAGQISSSPLAAKLLSATNTPLTTCSDTLLARYRASKETPADFSRFNYYQFDPWSVAALRKKYAHYPCQTIGEYHQQNHYPNGNRRDYRPPHFNPAGNTVCAHGSNFAAVLKAELNCHAQLVAVIKQFKLQGTQPASGESAYFGTTALNCRYVSAVDLHCKNASFNVAKKYAQDAATKFRIGQPDFFNSMPVVVIGEGIARRKGKLDTDKPKERAYKRVNIRLLALQNEQDKLAAMHWLKKASLISHFPHPDPIRFCTWAQLDACSKQSAPPDNHQISTNLPALWDLSQPLYPWDAPQLHRSWLARVFRRK